MAKKSTELKLKLLYRIWALDVILYLKHHHRESHQEGFVFPADFKLDCFLPCYLDWLLVLFS